MELHGICTGEGTDDDRQAADRTKHVDHIGGHSTRLAGGDLYAELYDQRSGNGIRNENGGRPDDLLHKHCADGWGFAGCEPDGGAKEQKSGYGGSAEGRGIKPKKLRAPEGVDKSAQLFGGMDESILFMKTELHGNGQGDKILPGAAAMGKQAV